jgi:integrase
VKGAGRGPRQMTSIPRRITGTIIITGTEEDAQAADAHGNRITVRDAAGRWLETYVQTQRAEQGRQLAAQRIKDFLAPYMGDQLLARVEREDMRAYRIWLERSTRLSMTSISHILSDARCMLNWCEDAGLIERSPFPRRIMPRLQERPPDRLTDVEVEQCTGLCEPYGFIARFGIGSGLRWGELVRAQARDLENDTIVVHHTKGRRVRRVPLPPALAAELHTRVGRLMPIINSSGVTRQIARRTGIGRFHPHMMRHTFACRWIEAGGSLAALQEMLGHASVTTTQRYARLGTDMIRREAERVYGSRQ